MTREEFNAQYNPRNKCTATFVDRNGDKDTGLLLDDVKTSATLSVEFVFINNFAYRVPLASLMAVKDTGTPWSNKP